MILGLPLFPGRQVIPPAKSRQVEIGLKRERAGPVVDSRLSIKI
jgi:hypothetical protein